MEDPRVVSGFKLVGVGVVHLDESPTLLRHLRQGVQTTGEWCNLVL